MHIVNTSLCSFGMSGEIFHAPFIHAHPGFNLYGVWERTKKKAALQYPAIKSFSSLETMLADDAIELVVVNTPNYTHFDFAKQALLANKYVLVEKSFTVTVSEAEELLKIANEKHRHLSVFQNRRYDSDFKTVKKILEEGSLGKIVEAEFHFDRFNLGLSLKQHKETTNPGAGLLYDLGPHIIDQALYLFGMPQSLFAVVRVLRPLSLVNDFIDILLFYPSLSVRLKASLVVKEPFPSYCLHGTHGSFIKERADVQEDSLKKGARPGDANWGVEPPEAAGILNIVKEGETQRTKIPALNGDYMEFYSELYDGLVNQNKLPVTAQDGVNVMRIIEAAQKSHITKEVVVV